MKHLSLMLLLSLTVGCSDQVFDIDDDSRVMVTVGGYEITEKYLQAYLNNQGISSPSKAQLDQALEALIKQQSLVTQAHKDGLELSIEQQLSIQQLKHQALSQLALKNHLQSHAVTDEEVKAEYNRIIAELKGVEYKVRHMLFQDEAQAIAVLDEIKSGQPYMDVEASYLAQHAGMKNVGDLGWINVKQVPKVFTKALKTMSPDQVYDEVLISQFGVHVLYLENQRKAEPPAFEQVKDGIKKTLEQKVIERYLQLVKAKAKVKVSQ